MSEYTQQREGDDKDDDSMRRIIKQLTIYTTNDGDDDTGCYTTQQLNVLTCEQKVKVNKLSIIDRFITNTMHANW